MMVQHPRMLTDFRVAMVVGWPWLGSGGQGPTWEVQLV